MKQIIPANWKNCATCARWGGDRRPHDPFLVNVDLKAPARASVTAAGFNQLTCLPWQPQQVGTAV